MNAYPIIHSEEALFGYNPNMAARNTGFVLVFLGILLFTRDLDNRLTLDPSLTNDHSLQCIGIGMTLIGAGLCWCSCQMRNRLRPIEGYLTQNDDSYIRIEDVERLVENAVSTRAGIA